MNLINKQVTHDSFGIGSVVGHTNSCVVIHFESGEKKFIYPDAFGKYLTLVDQHAADLVNLINQKREEKLTQEILMQKLCKIEVLKLQKEKVLQHQEQQSLLQREKLLKKLKIHASSQVVFGYEAKDLDRVFTEWKVFTGVTKSGKKAGQINCPMRLSQNSACLLTSKKPGRPEKDRRIAGFFMVNEGFIGKMCEDGYIPAHPEYRLHLTEQESKKMLFWNYYANEKLPQKMTLSSGIYHYFNNICMAQILRDIVSLRNETPKQEDAQNFFEYFCHINQIIEKELPKSNGALKRI